MPRPIKTKTIYRAMWRLASTKETIRDQFNHLASWADACGLELIDIPVFETDGAYAAILAGDLHAIFTFAAQVGYPAKEMKSMEIKA